MLITSMLEQVKSYQAKLGYDFNYETREEQMDHIRDLSLALNVEVAEFLEWLPFKPWRSIESQECNESEAAYELIDIFFFTVNLWCALGMPIGSFEHFFQSKMEENLSRIERGYNSVETPNTQGELDL